MTQLLGKRSLLPSEMVNVHFYFSRSNTFLHAALSAVLAALVIFAVGHAKQPACDLTDVPRAVQQLVTENFPEWRLWDRADLTDEEHAFWLKHDRRSSCPGLAIGYFSDKTRQAYAVSLIPKDSSREGWRLVVIGKDSVGAYASTVVERHDNYTDTGILWTVPPGTYADVHESDRVNLTLDGFKSHTYGKGETLYYWKNGKYHSFILAD